MSATPHHKAEVLTTASLPPLLACVEVASTTSFKAFRSYATKLDTIKIYTRAHGSKTTNLIINLDHPEWLLDADKGRKLADAGLGE